jgi:hypothetical protein
LQLFDSLGEDVENVRDESWTTAEYVHEVCASAGIPPTQKRVLRLTALRHYARRLQVKIPTVGEDGVVVYTANSEWWALVDGKIAALNELLTSKDDVKIARATAYVVVSL